MTGAASLATVLTNRHVHSHGDDTHMNCVIQNTHTSKDSCDAEVGNSGYCVYDGTVGWSGTENCNKLLVAYLSCGLGICPKEFWENAKYSDRLVGVLVDCTPLFYLKKPRAILIVCSCAMGLWDLGWPQRSHRGHCFVWQMWKVLVLLVCLGVPSVQTCGFWF